MNRLRLTAVAVAVLTLPGGIATAGGQARAQRLNPAERAWAGRAGDLLAEIKKQAAASDRASAARNWTAWLAANSRFAAACPTGLRKLDPPPTARLRPVLAEFKAGCAYVVRGALLLRRALKTNKGALAAAAHAEVRQAMPRFARAALRLALLTQG